MKIYTDVEVAYAAIVCPITASLTGGSIYVNLSGDYAVITVDKSKIVLPTDLGVHPYTLIVNERDWSSTVNQQTYSFNVIIVCTVSSLTITSKAADEYYILNQGLITTNPLSITQTDACVFPFTYTHTYTKDGSSITKPAWLNFDNAMTTYSFSISAPLDVGVYVVTATSEIPQVDPGTGVNRITVSSFIITVVSDCTITSLTDKVITDMTYGVTAPAGTQNIFFADAISTGHANDNYCGLRTYTLSPVLAFMSITGDVLSIETSNEAYIGPYVVTLTTQITDYPIITPVTKTFNVYITCGVQVVTFAAPLIPALTTV